MHKTRTLYASSQRLYEFGMVPFYSAWDVLAPVGEFFTSSDEVQHYEVARPPDAQGGWWLPVGTEYLQYWEQYGGVSPLKVEGLDIPTRLERQSLILRPKHVLYWIPDAVWRTSGLSPGEVRGHIKGAFPQRGPPEQAVHVRLRVQESEEVFVELEGVRFSLELPRGISLVRESNVHTLRRVAT